jgi:hypothetical protein
MPIEPGRFDDPEDSSDEQGRGRRRKPPAFKAIKLTPEETALANDLQAIAHCETAKEYWKAAQKACADKHFPIKIPRLFAVCTKGMTDKVFTALQRNGIGFYFTPYTEQIPGNAEATIQYLKEANKEEGLAVAGNKVEVERTAFAIDAAQLKKFLESEPVVKLIKRCREHEEAQKSKDPGNFPHSAHFVPLRETIERMALVELGITLHKILVPAQQGEKTEKPWKERTQRGDDGSPRGKARG